MCSEDLEYSAQVVWRHHSSLVCSSWSTQAQVVWRHHSSQLTFMRHHSSQLQSSFTFIILKMVARKVILCSTEDRKSCSFDLTWGWVNNDRFFFLVTSSFTACVFSTYEHILTWDGQCSFCFQFCVVCPPTQCNYLLRYLCLLDTMWSFIQMIRVESRCNVSVALLL